MDASFDSQILCRICYSNENKEELANWCNCSGTIALMHKSCLERWISHSFWGKCEICNYQYDFSIKIVKPTFKQWFQSDAIKRNNDLLNMLVLLIINAVPLFFYKNEMHHVYFAIQFFIFCISNCSHFRKWQRDNMSIVVKMNSECKAVIKSKHRRWFKTKDNNSQLKKKKKQKSQR